jgi:hypothetical protein
LAEEAKGRKAKLRVEGEAAANQPSAIQLAQPAPAVPEIKPEVRDELTSLMQELLLKTHELSFEYSTMECEEISNCPLAKKSKELFRTVKKLNELVRQMAPPPKPTYVG